VRTKARTSIPIVVVMVCCSAAATRSEDTSQAPPGKRSLGPLPFQLILAREHLMGDWYGTRTWLEDQRIVPTLTFVTDSLGNPSDGNERGFTTANNVGLDLNFDLEKLCGLEGGSFLLSMSYRFGGSLSANYIHTVFAVQQVFGGGNVPLHQHGVPPEAL
jgi:porin